MKTIYKDALTQLASEGYLTLQVPDCVIMFKGEEDPPTESVPDEWLVVLKNDRPAHSRESGFLYLTRQGYEANKDKLKKALEAAIAKGNDRTNGQGWQAFEKEVEEHFQKVEKNIAKYRQSLQKKLQESDKWTI